MDQYGTMTVDQLKAAAKTLGIKPLPRTKGALLTAILEAEKPTPQERYEAAETAAGSDAYAPVEAAPLEPAPTAGTAEPKGAAKAERLAGDVKPHGWETEILGAESGEVKLVARRGTEILEVVWLAGCFVYESSAYVVGDRVTKPRNANAARQLAARSPEVAAAELAKVGANRAWKRKVTAPTVDRKALPFDPDATPDTEIATALVGRKVTWFNRHSSATETARVSVDPRWFAVSGEGADRVVQFCSKDGGFRACRLAAISRVAR